MDPTTEQRKKSVTLDVDTANRSISTHEGHQQLEKLGTDALEPSIWHTLGRLLHEFIYIVFFMALHAVIKWGLTETHQEKERWAIYLLYVSIVYALTAFTVIFGAELVVDCVRAVRYALRQIRKK